MFRVSAVLSKVVDNLQKVFLSLRVHFELGSFKLQKEITQVPKKEYIRAGSEFVFNSFSFVKSSSERHKVKVLGYENWRKYLCPCRAKYLCPCICFVTRFFENELRTNLSKIGLFRRTLFSLLSNILFANCKSGRRCKQNKTKPPKMGLSNLFLFK